MSATENARTAALVSQGGSAAPYPADAVTRRLSVLLNEAHAAMLADPDRRVFMDEVDEMVRRYDNGACGRCGKPIICNLDDDDIPYWIHVSVRDAYANDIHTAEGVSE